MATVSSSPSFNELMHSIQAKGKLAPVYLIHGEEGYYTDRLVKAFENVVDEADRDFNLYNLYAPETSMATVEEVCRRYPMGADRQVVILRECQAAHATELNKLQSYLLNPSPMTVLALCFRGAQAKGKDLMTPIKAHGVIFESKKIKDPSSVLASLIKERGLNIEPKGMEMLCEHVGTDMSRLMNEVDKLTVALSPGAMITPEVVERNIGINKDYNAFELTEALGNRNALKAFKILEYARANPKALAWPMLLATIFGFFSDLMICQFAKDKSESGLAAALGKAPWAARRMFTPMRNYNAYQTIEIISALRAADVMSKGVGSRMDAYDLLHDLVFHILNAQGRI